jgi:hypothetical protein
MLKVKKFYARGYDIDAIIVFWELEDFTKEDDIYAYDFILSKSESPAGPFDVKFGPLKNVFLFRDSTSPQNHKLRTIYYKLKIVDTRTNESVEVGPTAQLAEPDLMAQEMIRQEDMLFRNFIGRKVFVFPAKTFGVRCLCVNKTLQRQEIYNCLTCYSVGYIGGYNSPIVVYMQIDPNPKNTQLTPHMNFNTNVAMGRMVSYPPVSGGDIIVENDNHRWIVVNVTTTERLRYPVHQELQLKELTRDDIVYKVPILDNYKNVDDVVDYRNFTNPYHVEAERLPNYSGNIPGEV